MTVFACLAALHSNSCANSAKDRDKRVSQKVSYVIVIGLCLGKQTVDVSSELWELLKEYDVPNTLRVSRRRDERTQRTTDIGHGSVTLRLNPWTAPKKIKTLLERSSISTKS